MALGIFEQLDILNGKIKRLCCAIDTKVDGSGTTNYLSKWTGSTALGNSLVYDDGTNVGIGNLSPSYKLDVAGDIKTSGLVRIDSSQIGQGATSTAAFGIRFNTNGYEAISFITPTQPSTDGCVKFVFNLGGRNYLFNNAALDFMVTTNTSSQSIFLGTSTTAHFAKFGNGNVAIGTNPSDAGYKLDVNGTARVSGLFTFENGFTAASGKIYDFVSGTLNNVRYLNLTSAATLTIRPDLTGNASIKQALYIYPTNNTNDEGVIQVWDSGETSCRFIVKSLGQVGIGTSSPDASALLDISSTTKGFLPPRMTGAQAEAITSPAEGLMVYSTDGSGTTITSKGWWGFEGATWVKLN